MTEEKNITSGDNPRIKNVVRLRDKSERDSQRLMIIDGYRAINLALNNNVTLKELFYCEKFFNSRGEKIFVQRAEQKGSRIFHLEEKVFRKIAYGDNPEGLLAIGEQVKKSLADLPMGKSALFIILESLEKPGNLGAILRSADAIGVNGVIVCNGKTDICNPNVIRSSRGTLFALPVVETTTPNSISWLKKNNIKIIAATPLAKVEYSKMDYKNSCAIVLGSEDKGISPAWLNVAEFKIKIPMKGQADSLNVSIAAAVILYEALRQRRLKI
ncbi:MAG: RNA methyltransferase [Candidatus Omnitrophota bacterium]|nr:RNA methyltransferase [Candidatus Omnitrophota bacterium]